MYLARRVIKKIQGLTRFHCGGNTFTCDLRHVSRATPLRRCRWKRWCRRSRLHLATGCGSRRRGSNRGPPITTEDAGSAGRQRDQPRTPRMRATPRARHPTLSRARTMLRERRRSRQRTPFPPLFSQNQRLATCRDTRVTGMSWDAGEILLVSSDDYIWIVEFSLEKKGEWFKIRRFF